MRSSNGNDVTIETQVKKLSAQYGEPDKIFTDKASGLNENRPGLKGLIQYIKNNPYTTIYITNNDRLTRFGYSYLEELFNSHNCNIVVLDSKETKEPHEVLMEDFMSLIASFSGKFYRLRGWSQRKQLLDAALIEVENNHE